AAPRGIAPVLDVMREGLLPAVEIDGGDALSGLEQRDRDMHGGGRLARPALFVAQHDYVRGARYATGCLEQHRPVLDAAISGLKCLKVKTDCTRSRRHWLTAVGLDTGVPSRGFRGRYAKWGIFGRSPRALPLIGARGSFDSPASMMKLCASEYHGAVTSGAGALSFGCNT